MAWPRPRRSRHVELRKLAPARAPFAILAVLLLAVASTAIMVIVEQEQSVPQPPSIEALAIQSEALSLSLSAWFARQAEIATNGTPSRPPAEDVGAAATMVDQAIEELMADPISALGAPSIAPLRITRAAHNGSIGTVVSPSMGALVVDEGLRSQGMRVPVAWTFQAHLVLALVAADGASLQRTLPLSVTVQTDRFLLPSILGRTAEIDRGSVAAALLWPLLMMDMLGAGGVSLARPIEAAPGQGGATLVVGAQGQVEGWQDDRGGTAPISVLSNHQRRVAMVLADLIVSWRTTHTVAPQQWDALYAAAADVADEAGVPPPSDAAVRSLLPQDGPAVVDLTALALRLYALVGAIDLGRVPMVAPFVERLLGTGYLARIEPTIGQTLEQLLWAQLLEGVDEVTGPFYLDESWRRWEDLHQPPRLPTSLLDSWTALVLQLFHQLLEAYHVDDRSDLTTAMQTLVAQGVERTLEAAGLPRSLEVSLGPLQTTIPIASLLSTPISNPWAQGRTSRGSALGEDLGIALGLQLDQIAYLATASYPQSSPEDSFDEQVATAALQALAEEFMDSQSGFFSSATDDSGPETEEREILDGSVGSATLLQEQKADDPALSDPAVVAQITALAAPLSGVHSCIQLIGTLLQQPLVALSVPYHTDAFDQLVGQLQVCQEQADGLAEWIAQTEDLAETLPTGSDPWRALEELIDAAGTAVQDQSAWAQVAGEGFEAHRRAALHQQVRDLASVATDPLLPSEGGETLEVRLASLLRAGMQANLSSGAHPPQPRTFGPGELEERIQLALQKAAVPWRMPSDGTPVSLADLSDGSTGIVGMVNDLLSRLQSLRGSMASTLQESWVAVEPPEPFWELPQDATIEQLHPYDPAAELVAGARAGLAAIATQDEATIARAEGLSPQDAVAEGFTSYHAAADARARLLVIDQVQWVIERWGDDQRLRAQGMVVVLPAADWMLLTGAGQTRRLHLAVAVADEDPLAAEAAPPEGAGTHRFVIEPDHAPTTYEFVDPFSRLWWDQYQDMLVVRWQTNRTERWTLDTQHLTRRNEETATSVAVAQGPMPLLAVVHRPVVDGVVLVQSVEVGDNVFSRSATRTNVTAHLDPGAEVLLGAYLLREPLIPGTIGNLLGLAAFLSGSDLGAQVIELLEPTVVVDQGVGDEDPRPGIASRTVECPWEQLAKRNGPLGAFAYGHRPMVLGFASAHLDVVGLQAQGQFHAMVGPQERGLWSVVPARSIAEQIFLFDSKDPTPHLLVVDVGAGDHEQLPPASLLGEDQWSPVVDRGDGMPLLGTPPEPTTEESAAAARLTLRVVPLSDIPADSLVIDHDGLLFLVDFDGGHLGLRTALVSSMELQVGMGGSQGSFLGDLLPLHLGAEVFESLLPPCELLLVLRFQWVVIVHQFPASWAGGIDQGEGHRAAAPEVVLPLGWHRSGVAAALWLRTFDRLEGAHRALHLEVIDLWALVHRDLKATIDVLDLGDKAGLGGIRDANRKTGLPLTSIARLVEGILGPQIAAALLGPGGGRTAEANDTAALGKPYYLAYDLDREVSTHQRAVAAEAIRDLVLIEGMHTDLLHSIDLAKDAFKLLPAGAARAPTKSTNLQVIGKLAGKLGKVASNELAMLEPVTSPTEPTTEGLAVLELQGSLRLTDDDLLATAAIALHHGWPLSATLTLLYLHRATPAQLEQITTIGCGRACVIALAPMAPAEPPTVIATLQALRAAGWELDLLEELHPTTIGQLQLLAARRADAQGATGSCLAQLTGLGLPLAVLVQFGVRGIDGNDRATVPIGWCVLVGPLADLAQQSRWPQTTRSLLFQPDPPWSLWQLARTLPRAVVLLPTGVHGPLMGTVAGPTSMLALDAEDESPPVAVMRRLDLLDTEEKVVLSSVVWLEVSDPAGRRPDRAEWEQMRTVIGAHPWADGLQRIAWVDATGITGDLSGPPIH